MFFALFLTCFLGFIAIIVSGKTFDVDYFNIGRYASYVFFMLTMSGKFISGFFHAYASDPLDQTLGLFIVNVCVLIGLAFCMQALHSKIYVVFYIMIYGCKTLLNFQLFIEMLAPNVTRFADKQTTENSLLLGAAVFGLMLLLYLVNALSRICSKASINK